MKKISILVLGAAFLLALAMSAQAVPVSNINGQWTALTGTPEDVTDLNNNEIGWGTLGKC